MNRLTHIDCDGWYIEDQSIPYDGRRRGEEINRLAAYEDTGRTPEEVEQMKIYMMPFTIKEMERFRKIMQAEKEGRLAVLPCKVGNIVYDISDGTPYGTRVLNFSYFGDKWACRTVSSYPNLKEFGKTVFLTREEAEAALEKREEDDEAN